MRGLRGSLKRPCYSSSPAGGTRRIPAHRHGRTPIVRPHGVDTKAGGDITRRQQQTRLAGGLADRQPAQQCGQQTASGAGRGCAPPLPGQQMSHRGQPLAATKPWDLTREFGLFRRQPAVGG